jgi:hypothetical protein
MLLAGCEVTEPDVEAGADWGYVYAVIEANCSCHHSEAGEAGLSMPDMATTYANLVGVASQELPGMLRVSAGDPDNSYLLHKIVGTHQDVDGSGARMPFGGPYLEDDMVGNIRDWIEAGASEEVTGDDDDTAGDDDDTAGDDDDTTGDDDDTTGDDDDSAPGDDDDSAPGDDDDSATVDGWTFTQVYAVLSDGCACHNSAGGTGGQALGTTAQATYDAIVNVSASNVSAVGLDRIEPGDSDNSFLMNKLDGTHGANEGQRMPFGGPYFDQATLDGIRSWIDAGALNN